MIKFNGTLSNSLNKLHKGNIMAKQLEIKTFTYEIDWDTYKLLKEQGVPAFIKNGKFYIEVAV